ncbi:9138_t:CDS:2 [Paraglomus brasilianum]|uniref:9138_t:CDS:1 n=1 Tax=Paraglomus brasilianum TaxID=144538 RepID=A0A9N8ZMR7_9GLOM|nr:9138_t:CDS:2 [Paraglomus brasilianum]
MHPFAVVLNYASRGGEAVETYPFVKDNAQNHFVKIGGFGVDNLLKDAATQALQNTNLALESYETAGIPLE